MRIIEAQGAASPKEQFEGRPELLRMVNQVLPPTQMFLVNLDAGLSGGLTKDELEWAIQAIRDPVAQSASWMPQFAGMINYMRTAKHNPKNYPFVAVRKMMARPAKYAEKLDALAQVEPTEDPVVHQFADGWQVVSLSEEALEFEEELVGGKLHGNGNVRYSIRDPNGVPFALVEVDTSQEDPAYFGVYQVALPYWGDPVGQVNDGEKYITEWFDCLKAEGRDPAWVNDDISEGEHPLKSMEDAFNLSYGAAPLLRGLDGDADDYAKTLQDAYSESCSGAHYYSSTAAKHIDNIVEYAFQRSEEKALSDAADLFFDKASEWFEENMFNTTMEHPYPDEDDFRTTVQPDIIPGQAEFRGRKFKGKPVEKFDKEGYDKALAAHDEEREGMEEYFEPYQFLGQLQGKINKLPDRRVRETAELQKKKLEYERKRREYEKQLAEQRMQQAIERTVSRGVEPDIETLVEERSPSFASGENWYRTAENHKS